MKRYAVTDLLDDLRDPRGAIEVRAICASLHETLADFYFRTRGLWSAHHKHIPRRLAKVAPELFPRWHAAFERAFAVGEPSDVICLSEEILRPFGGPYFSGFRRDAPAEFRQALPPPVEYKIPDCAAFQMSDAEKICIHPSLGELTIRSATIGDAPALRQLLNLAYKHLHGMGLNYTATFQDDDLTRQSLSEPGKVFVVQSPARGHQIIATMKLREHNAFDQRRCVYLSRFAIEPSLQRSGLGTQMLRLAETVARREGFECMQLDTAQPAHHLIAYYKSQGFEILRPVFYDGKTYVSWILEKPL